MTVTATAVAAKTGASPQAPAAVDRLASADEDEVAMLMAALPGIGRDQHLWQRERDARAVLEWLSQFPGQCWQDRWDLAAPRGDTAWVEALSAGDLRTLAARRTQTRNGLDDLLALGLVRPGYEFLAAYRSVSLPVWVLRARGADLLAAVRAAATDRGMPGRTELQALTVLGKLVLHTGRGLDALGTADFADLHAWAVASGRKQVTGLHPAWGLLVDAGLVTACELPLRLEMARGQRTAAELIDDHHLACAEVRAVFIRYLTECRPSVVYSTWQGLAAMLAGQYWSDLERHHPGISSLNVSPDVIEGWRQRMLDTPAGRGGRYIAILRTVRALTPSLGEWATGDPSWVPYAVPSPIHRRDLDGAMKNARQVTARMHQRVRERLPHVELLCDTARDHRDGSAALLAAALAVGHGAEFSHAGQRYRRDTVDLGSAPSAQRVEQTLVETWPPDNDSTSAGTRTTPSGPGPSSSRCACPGALRGTGRAHPPGPGVLPHARHRRDRPAARRRSCRPKPTRNASCWSPGTGRRAGRDSLAAPARPTGTPSRSPAGTATSAPPGRRCRTVPAPPP